MKKNIRNVEINGTSPQQDLLSALDGVWASSRINDWDVTHVSSRLEIWQRWCNSPGSYLLPRKAENTLMLKIYNNDGSTACKVVKIGDVGVKVDKPCFLEITITQGV